jgi:DNA-binding MarR family transcriptional regulator
MPSAPAIPIDLETAARLRTVLGRLARRLRPTAAGAAAGLSPTRAAVLQRIVREGRIRVGTLAESEGINPTMLSRTIATLLEDRLIERTSDPADRRSALLAPTPKGARLIARMRGERTDAVKLALAALAERERECLLLALPALEEFAERLREVRR